MPSLSEHILVSWTQRAKFLNGENVVFRFRLTRRDGANEAVPTAITFRFKRPDGKIDSVTGTAEGSVAAASQYVQAAYTIPLVGPYVVSCQLTVDSQTLTTNQNLYAYPRE